MYNFKLKDSIQKFLNKIFMTVNFIFKKIISLYIKQSAENTEKIYGKQIKYKI